MRNDKYNLPKEGVLMAKGENFYLLLEREDVVTKLVDIVIDFIVRLRKENKEIHILQTIFTHEIDKLINYIQDLCNLPSLEEDVKTAGARSIAYEFIWGFSWKAELLKDKEPFSTGEAAVYMLNWNNPDKRKQIENMHPIFFNPVTNWDEETE